MASAQDKIQAEAIAAVVRLYTGSGPVTRELPDGSLVIDFTPEQQKQLQAKLREWISAPPGRVRVNFLPVVWPVVAGRLMPWLVGITGLSFGAGYLLKKRT